MPRAFDVEAKERFLVAISRGTPPAPAAERLGFTFGTVKQHLKTDTEFAEGYEHAGLIRDERVEEAMYDLATEGQHLGAMKEWLHNRQADRWKDQTKQLGPGQGGGSTTVNIGVVTTDALRELVSGENRAEALDLLKQVPAIEATATEVA